MPGWAWGRTDPWAGLASPVGTPSIFTLSGLLEALELPSLVSPCAAVPSLNPCLPSPASWSTVEQSLVKLGENLNNLGSSPLRSQADNCVSLIKRWLCAAALWARGGKMGLNPTLSPPNSLLRGLRGSCLLPQWPSASLSLPSSDPCSSRGRPEERGQDLLLL